MVYAYSHAAGFGLGFLNLLGSILFFIFIFFAIKAIIYHFAGHKAGYRAWGCHSRYNKGTEDEAVVVARERFAKGEVTSEEFNVLKTGLGAESNESTSNSRWGFGGRDKALGIARMRFAKGEISLDEFEAVKKAL